MEDYVQIENSISQILIRIIVIIYQHASHIPYLVERVMCVYIHAL